MGAWTRRNAAIGLGTLLVGGAMLKAAGSCASEPDLARDLARIESRLGARLGVAVIDTGTGQMVGHRADERFPIGSTFKVLACGAVLARVDAGYERLDRRIRIVADDLVPHSPVAGHRVGGEGMTLGELCAAAMDFSDNTAANMILASLGGPAAVTAYTRLIGDTATRLDRTETALNEATPGDPRDTTTPAAMAADLRALVLGSALSPASRTRLADWMVANTTGGEKMRAGLPKDWRVGDRTGGGDHGTVNDVAVLWPPGRAPLVATVYITETVVDVGTANAAIADVGRAIARTITV